MQRMMKIPFKTKNLNVFPFKENLPIGKPLGADRGLVALILQTFKIFTTSTYFKAKILYFLYVLKELASAASSFSVYLSEAQLLGIS